MKRRALPLLAALTLAIVATLALVAYVQGVESRALADVETVDVYVAKGAIGEGMTLEDARAEGLIEREQAPRSLVPATAVVSLDDYQGLVASSAIYPGEVLVGERFAAPAAIRQGFTIPEGMHAMSFEVGVPPGVAGFVRAGSKVSVLAQLDDTREEDAAAADGEPTTATTGGGPLVHFLLHDVLVLNVGQTVVVTNGDDEEDERVVRREDRVLLTVAVTPEDAERLAFAVLNGDLWITLLPDGADPAPQTPGQTYDTVWNR